MPYKYQTETREDNYSNDRIERYSPLEWDLNTRVPESKRDVEADQC